MRRARIRSAAALALLLLAGCGNQAPRFDRAQETAAVTHAITESIRWCIPEKDRGRLYAHVAPDSSFFMFQPSSQATIKGFAAFQAFAEEVFFNPAFKAISSDIKELRVTIGPSGDVAWFACLLDDIGEWDGRRIGWHDCRWTGVLEKRDGKWLLMQQHFSLPTDRPAAAASGDSSASG